MTLIERLSAEHLKNPNSDVGYLLVEAMHAILELQDRLEIRTEYAEVYEQSVKQKVQAEMAQLRIKASHSLANNLCPDHRDKQRGKPCLACEIERLERELTDVRNAVKLLVGRYFGVPLQEVRESEVDGYVAAAKTQTAARPQE